MHQFDIKKTKMFNLLKRERWDYQMTDNVRFKAIYSTKERNQVISFYSRYKNNDVYNGSCVCLEGITTNDNGTKTIFLSIGQFYDFVCCNVIGREMSTEHGQQFIQYLKENDAPDNIIELAQKLGDAFNQEKENIKSFDDLLKSTFLPNVIAVSTLAFDEEKHYLLTRRTDNVLIGKKLYGVTSTGTVDPADIKLFGPKGHKRMNPFCLCAQRELFEETPLQVSLEDFTIRGFTVGLAKLQPIVLIDCFLQMPVSDDYKILNPNREDELAELMQVVAVPQERLYEMTCRHDMTEASAYHMRIHARELPKQEHTSLDASSEKSAPNNAETNQ